MNIFVKIIFSILLFFLPLAFAGTESWAFFIFQSSITFIFCYTLITAKYFYFTKISKILFLIFSILILLGFVQSLNFHTIEDPVSLIPFTICPFYTFKEISALFVYICVFFIVLQTVQTSSQIKKLVPVILYSSALVMVVGLLYQKGEYIKFFLFDNSLGSFGPFVNRNSAGAFLSLSFFVSFAFLFSNIFRYKKEHKKKQEFIFKILVQSVLTFLLLVSIIFVRSRGVYLATLVSLFVMFSFISFYIPHHRKIKIICFISTLIVFLISCFLIYSNWDAISAYTQRVGFGFSEQARLQMYSAAFDMLKKYPLTGVGLAAFPVAIKYFLQDPFNQWVSYLHNDWLELLLDVGYIFGVIITCLILYMIWLFISNIVNLKRVKKCFYIGLGGGLLSFCIASGVDFHFHIPADAFLFFIVLALASALSFHKTKISTIKINIVIKILLILISVVFLFFSFKNAAAWKFVTFADNLTLENKIEYYQKALQYSSEPRYIRKLIFAYYNTKFSKTLSQEEKSAYAEQANAYAEEYLTKYPYDKQISKIYLNTL